ncbi:hypothetical protein HMPREF9071_1100 [Capnocytophaga sp. oral taxon 338 str. F0234]|nr:hypothetical protein HMPREF9071_1100 [Capnocytophaga sp. oral taxon 338 str. F0234]
MYYVYPNEKLLFKIVMASFHKKRGKKPLLFNNKTTFGYLIP